jgi:AcrR family transcriptional regulator
MMIVAAREDKKEVILTNAISVFAEKGYYKATTAMIAASAGVTQPYVFHFFTNKEELFKAVLDRAFSHIYDAFAKVEAPSEKLIEAMGHEFFQVMKTHRDEVLMVMQAHSIAETGIRDHVRNMYQTIFESVSAKMERAGIPNAKSTAAHFIGTGLLITVSEVLGLPQFICGENNVDC